VRRALASAAREGKPINRAVSAAENMGLSGIDTPETALLAQDSGSAADLIWA